MAGEKLVFACYSDSIDGVSDACRQVESIRMFAGKFHNAPFWLYIPYDMIIEDDKLVAKLNSLGIEIRTTHTPEAARWFNYAGKTYAAGEAEAAAVDQVDILVWTDDDSIILREPSDFDFNSQDCFAYRPVMHNRSGSLYDSPPDVFWSRIYDKLAITDEMLFPMVTPADHQKIRAYFQAGLLVVRPHAGILRRWGRDFETLYTDDVLAAMCREERTYRVFLHQAALVGAVLHSAKRGQMVELSDAYNYPIFFEKQYGADNAFDSIDDVVILRCVVSAKNIAPDWHKKLAGSPDRIAFLKEHLFRV